MSSFDYCSKCGKLINIYYPNHKCIESNLLIKEVTTYANMLKHQTSNGIYTGNQIREIGENILKIIRGERGFSS